MERRSDRHTYTKPIGLDTMSLLIRLPFFGETGPEDGELAIGGAALPRRELLGPGKSSYRGPATGSGAGSALAPHKNREGDGVGISASRS